MTLKNHFNLAFLILVALFNMVNGKAIAAVASPNWDPVSKETKNVCQSVQQISIPSQDRPDEANKQSLNQCDALSLYYGFGNAPNYTKARECAFINNNYDVLTMVYANGKGVKPELNVALHYACILDAAPAEIDGRISHLVQIRDTKNSRADFDICDDVTSGFMMGQCAALDQRFENAQQEKNSAALQAKWTVSEHEAFQNLRNTSKTYFQTRIENELDNSGSGRAAFMIAEKMKLNQRMMQIVTTVAQCKLPSATLQEYQDADQKLNALYKKILQMNFEGPSTVTVNGIKETERAWLKYRDALVNFAQVKCPNGSVGSVQILITKDRIKDLEGII